MAAPSTAPLTPLGHLFLLRRNSWFFFTAPVLSAAALIPLGALILLGRNGWFFFTAPVLSAAALTPLGVNNTRLHYSMLSIASQQ